MEGGIQTLVWLAVAIAATVYLYRRAATRFGPHDFSANGVVVGRAKQFDNRSLTLILEQLDAALARLNVVSQSIAQNLGALQEQRSTDWSRSLSLAYGAGDKPPAAGDGAKGDGQSNKQADGSADKADGGAAAKRNSPAASPPQGFAPQFASAAGDALTEQMSLAYQIVNLNERALSDRLWGEGSRLQVVLGFQVSINPPSWAKDCAAVVEVEVKVPDGVQPISVVAMIPQEKTYNVATLSSISDSLDGSVVSALWRAGASIGRRRNDIFSRRKARSTPFPTSPAPAGRRSRSPRPCSRKRGWRRSAAPISAFTGRVICASPTPTEHRARARAHAHIPQPPGPGERRQTVT